VHEGVALLLLQHQLNILKNTVIAHLVDHTLAGKRIQQILDLVLIKGLTLHCVPVSILTHVVHKLREGVVSHEDAVLALVKTQNLGKAGLRVEGRQRNYVVQNLLGNHADPLLQLVDGGMALLLPGEGKLRDGVVLVRVAEH